MARKAKLVRIAFWAGLILSTASYGFAQSQKPCLAFLRKGDIVAECGGTLVQVTRRGGIDEFAVSNEQPSLAFVTSRVTSRTTDTAEVVVTATVVDLKTGRARPIVGQPGQTAVVGTCGGLFWITNPTREHSDTRDLATRDEIAAAPYTWFRCSSDRKTMAGALERSGGGLYEGIPPQVKVSLAGSFSPYTFNLSPDGSKIAYFTDTQPLCLFSAPGPAECAVGLATIPDTPSVNNSGEVLVAVDTLEGCFYKTASDYAPDPRGANGPCLGIGYWKPGLKSINVIEPLGRNPQWISPTTAALLRNWGARLGVGAH